MKKQSIPKNKSEICENCSREIGELERVCVFENKILCEKCDKKLRKPITLKEYEEKPIDVTLEELNELFGEESSLTSLQKEEKFKKYKGKSVQWTGQLISVTISVNKLYTTFKHSLMSSGKTFTSFPKTVAVEVTFSEQRKDELLKLKKNSRITYQGKLPETCIQAISILASSMHTVGSCKVSLTNGEIVLM